MGQLVAGRYRLLRTLATGGTGPVWLAADQKRHRQVAIKKCALPSGLDAEERELVLGLTLREARAFARVSHPNVIRILDVLPDENEPWIVMEYVPSRSLLQVIQENGPLPPARAATVGLAVLHGLNAVHRTGMLHLDVKPANVLMADDGRIVLTDFGPAVTDDGVRALADAGIILGSPKYVAPERLLGGASTTPADLWSLGATLYHAVEGRPPYVHESVEATLKAVAAGPPDPPRLAGPLTGVVEGLLRSDPEARLLPLEVESRLRRVAHPPAPPRKPWPPLARRAVAVSAALALIAALGGVDAATRTGQQAGTRSALAVPASPRALLVLPSDFSWWHDPAGFRVAVPSSWQRFRDATGVLTFAAPQGWPHLRISMSAGPPGNAVAALVAEEGNLRLTAYRRIRIEAVSQPPGAVWEYTYRSPTGEPMRGLRRLLAVDGRTYVIEWRAPRAAWSADLQTLSVVQESFGPLPGA